MYAECGGFPTYDVNLDDALEEAITVLDLDSILEEFGFNGFIIQRCIDPTFESRSSQECVELKSAVQRIVNGILENKQKSSSAPASGKYMIEKVLVYALEHSVKVTPLSALPIKTVDTIVNRYYDAAIRKQGASTHPLQMSIYHWLSNHLTGRIQDDIDNLIKKGELIKHF